MSPRKCFKIPGASFLTQSKGNTNLESCFGGLRELMTFGPVH